MGDLIHTFPALTDLSEHRPNEFEITWLVEESFADVAKMHPMTKEVIIFGSRRWKKISLIARLGKSLEILRQLFALQNGI